MATQDFVQTELHPDSFAEISLDHPLEFLAPPSGPYREFTSASSRTRKKGRTLFPVA